MDIKTFFQRLFGTLKKEVKTEVNRAKQQLESEARQAMTPKPQPQQPQAPQPQAPQPQPEPEPKPQATIRRSYSDSEWMAYFKEILSQEFSQYAVRENVPVQELAGDISEEFQLYPTRPYQAYKAEWGFPYSFVLYAGDSVKAVMFVGKSQNQSRLVKFLISKMYAKKMNLPFITFYMDAPNERDYVVERIGKFINR